MMKTTGLVSHYETLGVPQNASLKDINSAYKKLALKVHPDKLGDGNDTGEEFRKIQLAIEVLRDSVRRQKHDYDLNIRKILEEQQRKFPFGQPDYDGWMPHSGRPYGLRDPYDRYMYSYKNSVHMDSTSPESREEKQRVDEERRAVDELFRKVPVRDEDRRREAMRERVRCDEEQMNKEEKEEEDGADEYSTPANVHSASANDANKHRVQNRDEYQASPVPENRPVPAQQAEENNEQSEEDDELFVPAYSGVGSSRRIDETESCRCYGDDEDNNSADSYDKKSSSLGLTDAYAAEREEGTDVFYSSREIDSSEQDDDSSSDDDDGGPSPSPNNQSHTGHTGHTEPVPSKDLFADFFTAKLNHPSGKYTLQDYQTELKGLVMEAFCGWLEATRLSFPSAEPQGCASSPATCRHLGYWEKEFGRPECEVCHRFMPLCTLKCPGCGMRACIACKFTRGD